MENPETHEFPARVATAGEALIDLVMQADGRLDPCLGGAVYNLTRALSRQGMATLYLNPLSGDRFGRQLAQGLVQDGVQLARAEPVPEASSLAVVGLSESGHPDYAFYREQVADRAVTAQGLVQACARAPRLELVCTGALALAAEDADKYLPWLAAQRAAGRLVVVDANLRPSVMRDLPAYRRNVLAALQYADLVKVSDEDLEALDLPGESAEARAQRLLAATPAKLLALTLGADGAALARRDAAGTHWLRARESQPVAVVDTVGAGDSFLAGLLTALLRGADEAGQAAAAAVDALDEGRCRELLAHALASASLCVMQRGCVPPTWEQVRQRVGQVPASFA